MWELLFYADWAGLFTPSLTRELRRTERRIASAARRAARDSPFRAWTCMPEVDARPRRPMLAPQAIKLLARLEDSEKPFIPAHNVTVVVARPGEETLACGATLSRLRGAKPPFSRCIALARTLARACTGRTEILGCHWFWPERRGGERSPGRASAPLRSPILPRRNRDRAHACLRGLRWASDPSRARNCDRPLHAPGPGDRGHRHAVD